jgi:hypothetical protein
MLHLDAYSSVFQLVSSDPGLSVFLSHDHGRSCSGFVKSSNLETLLGNLSLRGRDGFLRVSVSIVSRTPKARQFLRQRWGQ